MNSDKTEPTLAEAARVVLAECERQDLDDDGCCLSIWQLRLWANPPAPDPLETEITALIEEWESGPMAPEMIRKAFLRGMELAQERGE